MKHNLWAAWLESPNSDPGEPQSSAYSTAHSIPQPIAKPGSGAQPVAMPSCWAQTAVSLRKEDQPVPPAPTKKHSRKSCPPSGGQHSARKFGQWPHLTAQPLSCPTVKPTRWSQLITKHRLRSHQIMKPYLMPNQNMKARRPVVPPGQRAQPVTLFDQRWVWSPLVTLTDLWAQPPTDWRTQPVSHPLTSEHGLWLGPIRNHNTL